MRFILTGGEAHDVTMAADLVDGQTADGIIADKAYETDALREMIEQADRFFNKLNHLSAKKIKKPN